jgi:hypothetical protein
MLAATLHELSDAGYRSSQRLRADDGRRLPSVIIGILFTETAPEISGLIYQMLIEAEQEVATFFGRRLGYPVGSLEPQIIASAFMAAWRVTVYGYVNMIVAGVDPPPPDEIGTRAFAAYAKGIDQLWT